MLTDKQIEDIALEYTRVCGGYASHEDAIPDRDVIDFARAIEKAVLFDELQTQKIVDANEKLVKELKDAKD